MSGSDLDLCCRISLVNGVPSLFFVSSAIPQPKLALCGIEITSHSPVHFLCSQFHKRSGELFSWTALAIESGRSLPRKMTFRCNIPMRSKLAVHSKEGKVVNLPGA